MIGYATIGVSNMESGLAFYDALLGEIGAKQLFGMDRIKFYGTGEGPMLAVCIPYDEQAPNPGNGPMVAFAAASPEIADKLHAKALSLGGTDEGAPGWREASGAGWGTGE